MGCAAVGMFEGLANTHAHTHTHLLNRLYATQILAEKIQLELEAHMYIYTHTYILTE